MLFQPRNSLFLGGILLEELVQRLVQIYAMTWISAALQFIGLAEYPIMQCHGLSGPQREPRVHLVYQDEVARYLRPCIAR